MADAIAQQVRAQITPAQQTQMGRAAAVNPAAYDAYIQGRLYFTTEYTKPASLRKAQHLFEDVDPRGSKLRACLCGTGRHLRLSGLRRSHAQGCRHTRSAKKLVARALELDDSMAKPRTLWARWSSNFDWDWDAADRAFSRAIALAPSYSCAHEDRAIFLAFLGRRSRSAR